MFEIIECTYKGYKKEYDNKIFYTYTDKGTFMTINEFGYNYADNHFSESVNGHKLLLRVWEKEIHDIMMFWE